MVEKAYAKLFGTYENLIAGFSLEAFGILTGAPTEQLIHQKHKNIIERIEEGLLQGFAITAITPKIPKDKRDEYKETIGLGSSHCYTVLRIFTLTDHRLIMLRNPNMKLKWKGDWSDSCPKWTSEI